ncbi:MAG: propanoyl-CoA acyltransferase, partial [Elusimicrobia bacterium]
VKNRAYGAKNPKAHLKTAVSAQEVHGSRLVAPPLSEVDISPISDGAAAVILASEDFAKKRCSNPVWVEGVGMSAGAPMTDRNLAKSRALRDASKAAYQMAGVASPSREIDAAEISEEFSYQELLWLSEMNFPHGDRTNRSGGCLAAHSAITAGLVRIIEATLQIRGTASSQIDGVKRALAHGQNGICGQSHCVWILGKN